METDSSSVEEIDSDPPPRKIMRKQCTVCGIRVFDRRNLVRHMRHVHLIEPKVRRSNLRCSFNEDCTFLCGSSELLRNHLKLAHNFKVEKRSLTFASKAEFDKWKVEEEVLTNARYVAYTGTKCKSSGRVLYLRCHRSGSLRPDSDEGKPSKPGKGNTQIGAICPSTIRVSELADGTIHAMYYPDHLGHSLDDESVRYMKLSALERKEILGKLAIGEPVGKIVTDARKKKGNRLSRLNFLQRRDVYNLKKKVIYLEKDEEQDAKMVDAWVKGLNLGSEDRTPIVYYSPMNKYKDYAMVIIHDIQREVFSRAFDGSIVYVKTKKGKPNLDFNLTAVSIVTANGEGFPIAFCISQKAEYVTLHTLYYMMSRTFGMIKPKFFISDNLCQSYLAWRNVMGECENQMICIFDLESYWGQKLTQYKVPVYKQKNAMTRLKCLLYEWDKETFVKESDNTLRTWCADRNMKAFMCYFQRQYVRKCTEWAGCFRTLVTPHQPFDLHLEPINGILDAIYVESYTGLSNALNYLMSYIRDSCLLKVIKWDENYRNDKMEATERNHAEGAEIKSCRTNGSEWVCSQDNFDFVVKKVVNDCDRNCGIFCVACDVCVHQYSCFCKDYVVGFNLCKHIHAARMAMARAEEEKEKLKKVELMAKNDRIDKTGEAEKTDKNDKNDKPDKPDKPDVVDKTKKRGRKGRKGKKKKSQKVEKQKRKQNHSVLLTVKSFLSDMDKSELTNRGRKNIADLLLRAQKNLQYKPLADIHF